jgi:hypothetical protein
MPNRELAGSDVHCRESVCVKPIPLTQQLVWADALASDAAQDACPRQVPTNAAGACADCDEVWIKSIGSGRYREQSCQQPREGTFAATLLRLMQDEARSAGY